MFKENISGQHFNRLTAIAYVPTAKGQYWSFRCDCGTVKVMRKNNVKRGAVKSCGCLEAERINKAHENRKARPPRRRAPIPHGSPRPPSKTRQERYPADYGIWEGMIRRCHSLKDKSYPRYGARGITVCDRWRQSFQNFTADMGPRPSKGHSIDRIDGTKGYAPGNCRWATVVEQQRNRKSLIRVEFNGEQRLLVELADEFGCKRALVTLRYTAGRWPLLSALGIEPRVAGEKRGAISSP